MTWNEGTNKTFVKGSVHSHDGQVLPQVWWLPTYFNPKHSKESGDRKKSRGWNNEAINNVLYNKCMWGVDRADQMVPCCPCCRNPHEVFDFMFQLNAPFVYYIYRIPLHVSSNTVLIIRRIHCIHTTSGSLYVTLLRWPLSAEAVRGLASSNCLCTEQSPKKSDIQRTRCCMYAMNPPDDEHNVARNM